MSKESSKIKYLQDSIKIVQKPNSGESLSVFPRPGDKINLDFDTSSAQYKLVGSDIVVKIPGGGEIVFVSMTSLIYEENPPKLMLSNGRALDLSDILMQVDDVKESEISTIITDEMISLEEKLSKVKAEVDKESENLEKLKESQKKIVEQKRYEEQGSKSESDGDQTKQFKIVEEVENTEEAPINDNLADIKDFNTFTELIEEGSSNLTNVSDVTALLDFNVGLFQTQVSSEEGSAIRSVGGGGSVRARFDSSGEAQMEAETLDYSAEAKALSVELDNPEHFNETYISRLISIDATQPPAFEFSSITIKDIPSGYEIIDGVKNSDGSWTIARGTSPEELAEDPSLRAKSGFIITESGIELILKYDPNTTNKNFTMEIEATSTFDLANYKLDPSDPNYEVLDIPLDKEMQGVKKVGIELKDIEDESDFIYTGEEELGFVLSTSRNKNIILTSQGDSTVIGSLSEDTITAYGGDDTLYGKDGDDTFKGGEGDDTIIGGDGIDLIDFSDSALEINLDLDKGISEGEGSDTISKVENVIGSKHSDTLKGDIEINVIDGARGHDSIYGKEGDDTLSGGIGDDTLMGGDGDDLLKGDSGSDTANYESSSSGIIAYLQDPQVGSGDTPYGSVIGEGRDRLEEVENIDGSKHSDTLYGDNKDNILYGDEGDDLIAGGAGNDNIDGGDGFDTIDFSTLETSHIEVNLAQNYAQGDGLDKVYSIEKVIGTSLGDNITGDDKKNILEGGIGDDTLFGEGEDDELYGGIGDDTLIGGAGKDIIDGGLNTSKGDMVSYKYAQNPGGVKVDLENEISTGDGSDTLIGIENIEGSNQSDTLIGDGEVNTIVGLLGDDTLIGGGGDDTLNGSSGIDTADYKNSGSMDINLNTREAIGDGLDTLISIENINGSDNRDTIIGSADINTLKGNGGSDYLYGGDQNDTLDGGEGDDTLDGGAGDDLIDGGADKNMASYLSSLSKVEVDLSINGYQDTRGAGLDKLERVQDLQGSSHDDTLKGDSDDNSILGSKGNDFLYGGNGVDYLDGGEDSNTLRGGAGDDILYGVEGNDSVDFSNLNTTVEINLEDGYADGSDGHDTLIEIENAIGSQDGDTITSSSVKNIIDGQDGDDTLYGSSGNDTIYGGAGEYDIVDYSKSDDSVKVELFQNRATGDFIGVDFIDQVENIRGSRHSDELSGDDDINTIYGADGEDILSGKGGDDTLLGEDGSDTLRGGEGDDTLDGGDDAGIDVADYLDATASISVDLNTQGEKDIGAGQGKDTFISIEGVSGGKHSDELIGTEDDNYLFGNGGADTIEGRGGDDLIDGGEGDDDVVSYINAGDKTVVDLSNSLEQDTRSDGYDTIVDVEHIIGSSHNDTLTGSDKSNSLLGGDGDDTLEGLSGEDILDGGSVVSKDTVTFKNSISDVDVDISQGRVFNDGFGYEDSLISIEDIVGSDHNDKITGSSDINTLSGGLGEDTLDGGLGEDHIYGGLQSDTVDYSNSIYSSKVEVDLANNQAIYNGETDYLYSIENVNGTGSKDTIYGDGEVNILRGNGEDDFLSGGANSDSLFGGDGADTLIGGSGADRLDGGSGGVDKDLVDYSDSSYKLEVNLEQNWAKINGEQDNLYEIEDIKATNSADTIVADDQNNEIWGEGSSDFIDGAKGDDTLRGGNGIDTLRGGDGDDHLFGGSDSTMDIADYRDASEGLILNLAGGVDTSGAGIDTYDSIEGIYGSNHDDSIVGDSLDNTLKGESGKDTIHGGGGADYIEGNDNIDTLKGEGGIDTLIGGRGDDTLNGGLGDDTLKGGDNSDTVSYEDASDLVGVSLRSKSSFGADGSDILESIENVIGSSYSDTIQGDSGTNILHGGSGGVNTLTYKDITTSAGVKVDLSISIEQDTDGDGLDTISNFQNLEGSKNSDILKGDSGVNTISGLGGDDTLIGRGGDDTLKGSASTSDSAAYSDRDKKIVADLFNQKVYIDGGEEDTLIDIENIIGSSEDDTLKGDSKDNTLKAEGGDDLLSGAGGEDWLDGGQSDEINGDSVTYEDSANRVFVDLLGSQATTDNNSDGSFGGIDEVDTIVNIENIIGSKYNDTLKGDNNSNIIEGGDSLDSNNLGDDLIYASRGDDTIYGGVQGQDYGSDTVDYSSISNPISAKKVEVDLLSNSAKVALASSIDFTSPDFTDSLFGIENIIGTNEGSDTIKGDNGVNILQGLGGDNLIKGEDGDDFIYGGNLSFDGVSDGSNTLYGGDGLDNIYGGNSIDIIYGESDSDKLYGKDGNDTLDGGAGVDSIDGGRGNDTIILDGDGDIVYGGEGSRDLADFSQVGSNQVVATLDGSTQVDISVGSGGSNKLQDIENLTTADGDDNLTGDIEKNIFVSGEGDDYLDGKGNSDTLYGGGGDDELKGGSGDDYLYGGEGDDDLEGGEGLDYLDGGTNSTPTVEHDKVSFDSADDSVLLNMQDIDPSGYATAYIRGVGDDKIKNIEDVDGSSYGDTIISNDDTNTISGGIGEDTIIGLDGADELHGGSDSDLFISGIYQSSGGSYDIVDGDDGSDTIIGGTESDTMDYSRLSKSIDTTLDGNNYTTVNITDYSNDTIKEVENIIGSQVDDTIRGDGEANILKGEDGDDTLSGGGGIDELIGGDDIDTADYTNAANKIEVDLNEATYKVLDDGDGSQDKLSSIERVIASTHNDTLSGASTDDTLLGGDGADTLQGRAGADYLYGGSEDSSSDGAYIDEVSYEYITNSSHKVVVDLANNSGVVHDGSGATSDVDYIQDIENVKGSVGEDTIVGDSESNLIRGGDGNDLIDGSGGVDNLQGELGNDTFVSYEDDGNDDIDGGGGTNTLDYSSYTTKKLDIDLADGSASSNVRVDSTIEDSVKNIQNIYGGELSDTISGNDLKNTLYGGDGQDTLSGEGDSDTLYGGDDSDTLDGGDGDDTLYGNMGSDIFISSKDNDTYDGSGDDTGDIDVVDFKDATSGITIDMQISGSQNVGGGQGSDKFIDIEKIKGSAYADSFISAYDQDNIFDGASSDEDGVSYFENITVDDATQDYVDVNLLTNEAKIYIDNSNNNSDILENIENVIGSKGSDTFRGDSKANDFDGKDGFDTLSYDYVTNSDILEVDFENNTAKINTTDSDSFTDIEKIVGTSNEDIFKMHGGGREIDGGSSNDTADYSKYTTDIRVDFKTNTSDQGDSFSSVEKAIGGSGADKFISDEDIENTFVGGGGSDTIDYSHLNSKVTLTLSGLSDGTATIDGKQNDTVNSIENIIGSKVGDELRGDSEQNKIVGEDGTDLIHGGSNNDILYGDEELSDESGVLSSSDTLHGDSGNDTLYGGGGDDTLQGGDEDDKLYGQKGDDTLVGGKGSDTLDGGSGSGDFVDYSTASNAIEVDMSKSGFQVIDDGENSEDKLNNIEGIIGSNHDDSIIGSNSISVEETLYGGDGQDTLVGKGGVDHIFGGRVDGTDSYIDTVSYDYIDDGTYRAIIDLSATTGYQTEVYNSSGLTADKDYIDGVENVIGGKGDDTITGDGISNIIRGGDGDDRIDGGSGDISDNLQGEDGHDSFIAHLNDGADNVHGGLGSDTIDYSSLDNTHYINVTLGDGVSSQVKLDGVNEDTIESIENIIGTRGDDTLKGNEDKNIFQGAGGEDLFIGSKNDDLFIGGLLSDGGSDGEVDTVDYTDATGSISIDATNTTTYQNIGGGQDRDKFIGIDKFIGGSYSDNFESAKNQSNIFDGGVSEVNETAVGDKVSYFDSLLASDHVEVDLSNSRADIYEGSTLIHSDTLLNIESVEGSIGDDTFKGDGSANDFSGNGGDDTLDYSYVTSGEELVVDFSQNEAQVGSGSDLDSFSSIEKIVGTKNSDTFIMHGGSKDIDGGSDGVDVVDYSNYTTDLTIDFSDNSKNTTLDSYNSIEKAIGGSGDDTFVTDTAIENIFDGNSGNNSVNYEDLDKSIDLTLKDGAEADVVISDYENDKVINIQNITGGEAGDTIIGNSDKNTLKGGDGDDTLKGEDNKDLLIGGDGVDSIYGGVGDDIIYGDEQLEDESGTMINSDTLYGNSGKDTIYGGGGDDIIDGGIEENSLYGGAGDDTLKGGTSSDLIDGGSGADWVNYQDATSGISIDLDHIGSQNIGGGEGSDTITSIENVIGSANFNDTFITKHNLNEDILTTEDNNMIDGLGDEAIGGDTIDYSDMTNSNDKISVDLSTSISGGDFNGYTRVDVEQSGVNRASDYIKNIENVIGTSGSDTIKGDSLVNTIDSKDGDDTVVGGGANDTLIGGGGSDTLDFSYSLSSSVTIDIANNSARVDGTDEDYIQEFENFIGTNYDDTFIAQSGAVENTFNGSSQSSSGDIVDYSNYSDDLSIKIGESDTQLIATGDVDKLISIENIETGSGNDTIYADINNNSIIGGSGDDTILLGGYDDLNDTLTDIDDGKDYIDGGDGFNDTADYSAISNNIEVTLNGSSTATLTIDTHTQSDTLVNIENITSGSGDDTITGDAQINTLKGGEGRDRLSGKGNNDELYGEEGDDLLLGGSGDDKLYGGEGSDTFIGGTDNDTFTGGDDGGEDLVDYSLASNSISVDLSKTTSQYINSEEGSDTLVGIESVKGSSKDDTFKSDITKSNKFDGVGGSDTIIYSDHLTDVDDKIVVDLEIQDVDGYSDIAITDGGSLSATDKVKSVTNITATNGDDTIKGDNSNNTLKGGLGDDTLYARGGDDYLDGGVGGDDWVDYSANTENNINIALSSQSATYGAYEDRLIEIEHIAGSDQDDTISGDDDDNSLLGNDGDDKLYGGKGDDYLDGGDQSDTLDGGIGTNTLKGGDGSDFASYANSTESLLVKLADNSAQDRDLSGDISDTLDSIENIIGSSHADIIWTKDGEDNSILAGDEADTIHYSTDKDDDNLNGKNYFDGQGGVDTIDFSQKDDGSINSDYVDLILNGSSEATFNVGGIDSGVIKNIENVIGSSGSDLITADGEQNRVEGGDGADRLSGLSGHDYLDGGDDNDILYGGNDNDTLYGGNDDDTLYGDANSDRLYGDSGLDKLYGGDGADTIMGGSESDTIFGDLGDDTIYGNSDLVLGSEVDEINFSTSLTGIDIDLSSKDGDGFSTATGLGIGSDKIKGIENITGSSEDDTITGDDGINTLKGGNGDDLFLIKELDSNVDSIDGEGHSDNGDTIDYSSTSLAGHHIFVDLEDSGVTTSSIIETSTPSNHYDDEIKNIENIVGTNSSDTITGNVENNILKGEDGDDTLRGEAGEDILEGGDGADTLEGGSGADKIIGIRGDGDYVSYESDSSGVTVNLKSGTNTGGDALGDQISGIDNILGGAGSDTLTGNDDINTIKGGDSNDTLYGGLSDDVLYGGTGENFAAYTNQNRIKVDLTANPNSVLVDNDDNGWDGSDEKDTLYEIDNIIGSSYDDEIKGSSDINTLDGGDGDDILEGGKGADILKGGKGGDTFLQIKSDIDVEDDIDGGDDSDTIDYSSLNDGDGDSTTGGLKVTLNGGTQSDLTLDLNEDGLYNITNKIKNIENIKATDNNDSIVGDTSANSIEAADGDDIVSGGSENDTLIGGSGKDTLKGDSGDDLLKGEDDTDRVEGGIGKDIIYGGDNSDNLDSSDIELLDGGYEDDTIYGEGGFDLLKGGDGDDTLEGGDQNDTLEGGAGDDEIYGGINGADSGVDTASFLSSLTDVQVDLNGGLTDSGGAGSYHATSTHHGYDHLYGIENIIGSNIGNDNISANSQVNIIDGAGGDDTIDGKDGDDTLMGGLGDDTFILRDGDGSDIIDGGEGAVSQVGSDTVDYSLVTKKIILDLANGDATSMANIDGVAEDSITHIENIIGGTQRDTLRGNSDQNILQGGGEADILFGEESDDTLDGGEGSDTLDGGEGRDSLEGGDGDDTLMGGVGADKIYGGDRDDVDTSLNDTVSYEYVTDSTLKTLIDLQSREAKVVNSSDIVVNGDSDELRGIENAIGGAGNDTVIGSDIVNTLMGGDGIDTLAGLKGSDTLIGGSLVSDTNNYADFSSENKIKLTLASDVTTTTTTVYVDADDSDGVEFNGVNDESNTVSFINNIIGSDGGSDQIEGNDDTNIFFGQAGNDTLLGLGGVDTLQGGEGDDTLIGGDGSDTLQGGDGDDTIEATSATDGVDIIDGGKNVDSSSGSDTVDYSALGVSSSINIDLSLAASYDDEGNAGSDYWKVDISGAGDDDLIKEIENITGGDGKDTITGDDGDNTLKGEGGTDTIKGGDGRDLIYGGENTLGELETLEGGDGNDTIYAGGGDDTLDGGDGADTLEGGDGNDTLSGGAGDDQIRGGDDSYIGGVGGDYISYDGVSDSLTIFLDTYASSATVGVDILDSIENIISGSGDDIIVDNGSVSGYKANNIIEARDGNDTITERDGDDTIYGGLNDDTIIAGVGNDYLDGGGHSDTVDYSEIDNFVADIGDSRDVDGGGSDTTESDAYNGIEVDLENTTTQRVHAQAGEDRFIDIENITGTSLDDYIKGNNGQNILKGGAGSDFLIGKEDNDSLYGGEGSDRLDGGTGSDYIHGGANYDTVDYSYVDGEYSAGLDVEYIEANLASSTNIIKYDLTQLEYDTLSEIENYIGFKGKDIVTGTSDKNTIYGRDGDDTISSGTGEDILYGEGGDDLFFLSDSGKNVVYGGGDVITGDKVSYKDSGTSITLSWDSINSRYEALKVETDELNSIEIVEGSNLADDFTGGDGVDSFLGGAGNDKLEGGLGEDYIEGGSGIDEIKDHLGNDKLYAGDGAGKSGDVGDKVDFSAISSTHYIDIDLSAKKAYEKKVSDDSVEFTNDVEGFNVVIATNGSDRLKGSDSSKDTLSGSKGDDTFIATDGGDEIHGGEHTQIDDSQGSSNAKSSHGDWIDFSNFSSSINATMSGAGSMIYDGIEHILGTTFNDKILGDSFNNTLDGGSGTGSDTLDGALGDDTLLSGDGSDTIYGGEGIDYIDAGDNTTGDGDWLSYDGIETGSNHIEVDLSSEKIIKDGFGTDGTNNLDVNETVVGVEHIHATDKDDSLSGNTLSNSIRGEDGKDLIYGDGGDDYLYGGLKNDTIYGEDGADKIYGEGEDDTIYGGDSSDTIYGGGGNDHLYGKLDKDDSNLDGDTIYGGANVDTIYANDGEDNIYYGGEDSDTTTTAGDSIDLSRVSKDTKIDLTANELKIDSDSDGEFIDEGKSDIYRFNVVKGSDQSDYITGNDESDIKDTLRGSKGSDIFYVSAGGDYIDGGDDGSEDTYDFSTMDVTSGDAGATIVMKDSGVSTAVGSGIGSSEFIEIENIVGSDGHDTITGDSGVNTISSGSGDDTIYGSGGVDYIDGGSDSDGDWLSYDGVSTTNKIVVDLDLASDQISENGFGDLSTAVGIEHIHATDKDDSLSGNTLSNSIRGEDGKDLIYGDGGR
jgi:Ca2+-binding RTX toxin-like protein